MRKNNYRRPGREIRMAEKSPNRLVRNGREYVAQWLNLFESEGPARPQNGDVEEKNETTFGM